MTFDGPNRRIVLADGTTAVTAVEVYSAWKDWVLSGQGAPFPEAFRVVGGDPLGGGVFAGAYFFLQTQHGWRIRPYEGSHVLIVTGNFYADSADPVFAPTLGAYNVQIVQALSSLTQQVAGAGGGGGSGMTPAQEAKLNAIKAKTDNLPPDPARQETVEEARDYAAAMGD